jgi:hypothetical protein
MTTIKTTCTRCGAIELIGTVVALELLPGSREGHYRFTCPTCAEAQRRPANARVVTVLLATGARVEIIRQDPITEFEIAAFAAAIESESDPFRRLAG